MGGLFLDASSSNTTMDAPHTSASLSSAAMGTSVLPLTNAGLMTAKTAAGGFHYNGSLNCMVFCPSFVQRLANLTDRP